MRLFLLFVRIWFVINYFLSVIFCDNIIRLIIFLPGILEKKIGIVFPGWQ